MWTETGWSVAAGGVREERDDGMLDDPSPAGIDEGVIDACTWRDDSWSVIAILFEFGWNVCAELFDEVVVVGMMLVDDSRPLCLVDMLQEDGIFCVFVFEHFDVCSVLVM